MNIFVETSIVNNILDLNEKRTDLFGKKQMDCLRLILEESSAGKISLFINASVIEQINNTKDEKRRKDILLKC